MRRRRLAWILLAALAGGCALLVLSLPWLAERITVAWLGSRGVSPVALSVRSLGLQGLHVADVAMGPGPDLRIDEVQISWSIGGLLRRRIDRVRVEGVVQRLALDDQGASLGALDSLLPEPAATPAASPRAGVPFAIDSVRLRDASLELRSRQRRLRARFDAHGSLSADALRSLDAAVRVEDAAGRLIGTGRFVLEPDGKLEAAIDSDGTGGLAWLSAWAPGASASGGRLRLRAEGRLPDPPPAEMSPLARLRTAAVDGRLEMEVENFTYGEAGRAWSGGGGVRFALHDARLALDGDGLHLESDGLSWPDLSFSARASVGDNDRITLETLELEDVMGRLGPARVEGGVVRLRGWATRSAGEARVDLHAKVYDPLGPERLDELSLELALELRYADGLLEVAAPGCAKLRLSGALSPELRLDGPSELCLEQVGGAPLLIVEELLGDVPHGRLRAAFAAAPAALDGVSGDETTPFLRGVLPRVELAATTTAAGDWSALLRATDGDLRMPGLRMTTALLDVELEARGRDRVERAELRGRVVRIARGEHALVRPLVLAASAEREEGILALRARLEDPDDTIVATLQGQHELETGRGTAHLALEPLRLAPGTDAVATVFPVLAAEGLVVSGTMSAAGELSWTGRGFESILDLAVAEVSVESEALMLIGVSGDVHFESLTPPRTAPGQRLRFERIEAGLPLSDGALAFALEPRRFVLEGFEGSLAGGIVRAEGSLALDASAQRGQLTLDGVELGTLLRVVGVEGLGVTGSIDGGLTVVAEKKHLAIRDGRLESDSTGGVIRYRPGQVPPMLEAAGESGNLVLEALENFHYEHLEARIEGEVDRELRTVVELRGFNPDLQGGRPIELTLNVTSALGDALHANQLWRQWIRGLKARAGVR